MELNRQMQDQSFSPDNITKSGVAAINFVHKNSKLVTSDLTKNTLSQHIRQLGLSIGKKKTGGRNNQGRITAFHRGGGNKIRYIYLNITSEDTRFKNFQTATFKNKNSFLLGKATLTSPSVSEPSLGSPYLHLLYKVLGTNKTSGVAAPTLLNSLNFKNNTCTTKCWPNFDKKEIYARSVGGKVKYIVKDSNRTAYLAGIYWSNPFPEKFNSGNLGGPNPWYSYYSNILAPEGLTIGSDVTNVISNRASLKEREQSFGHLKDNIVALNEVQSSGVASPSVSVAAGVAASDKFAVIAPIILSKTIGQQSYLKDLMVGTLVHNIQGKYIRAAGCSGIIISKSVVTHTPLGSFSGDQTNLSTMALSESGVAAPILNKESVRVVIKLQSGQTKVFSGETIASLGVLSHGEHKTIDYRKAGQKRWLGRRPIVRGVAMNPIDHPHGGGEGKTSGGRPSVTPWGKPTKGKPTRSRRR